MYQVFTILFLLFSLQSYSADLKIEQGSLEQVKQKDKYPLKLIFASDSMTLYTMGDKNYNAKTLVYANRRLRNIKTSNLKTSEKERADNFIWTGENVIVLWENKKGKDRELYYQTILKNGRMTTKVKLDVLKDGFSPYLREYQVKTLSSPDNTYFAFIIKGIVSKSFYGKNAVYDELIAVFDQNGKLLDKQKIQFQQAKDFEKFYFLTDSSDVLKISSQQAKDKILVERKNILNKEKEIFSIPFDRPDSIFIKQYRIDYNPTTHHYNYFARIKSADSIIGQNGIFVANFDLSSRQQAQSSIYIFDSSFVESFMKNPTYSNGNILYKDHSLNEQYVTKKVLPKQDGGFYYVQEHFSQESFLIKNDKEQREKPDELKSFLNVDNLPNVPLHTYEFIVTNTDKNGHILWVQRVPKYQKGLSYQYGSFDAFTDKNDLYLLYNKEERKKNFTKSLDSNYIAVTNLVTVGKKVSDDGEVNFYNLENLLKKNLVLFPIFSTTETQRNRLTTFVIESTSSEPCRGELIQVKVEN